MVLTDYQEMIQALGNENTAKLVSAEMVAVGWLETRSAKEMAIYPQIVKNCS